MLGLKKNTNKEDLLVNGSGCVRTLASLAGLESRQLGGGVEQQDEETYQGETLVHSVHGDDELLG